MKRSATYGQRLRILYVIIVLGVFAFYQRGVRPLMMKAQASAAMEEVSAQATKGGDLAALEKRLSGLQELIGDQARDPNVVQHELLQHIGSVCHRFGTELVAVAPGDRRNAGEHTLATEWITLGGGFHGLVRTIEALERELPSSARIVSMDMRAQELNFGQQRGLHATICFQSVLPVR